MNQGTEDKSAKKILVKGDPKGDSSHHMPIPRRSFVTPQGTAEDTPSPDGSNDTPESRSSILPPAKRNVIQPPADFKLDTPSEEEKPAPKYMDTKPTAKKSSPPAPDQQPTEEAAEKVDTEEETSKPADTPAPAPETASNPSNTTDPQTQKKSDKSSAEDEKRQKEIDDLIESHKYYIPVNGTVERHTIKINAGLTVVIFLLAIVLIDLMLDSGTILLLQKIPHTHFFSLSSKR